MVPTKVELKIHTLEEKKWKSSLCQFMTYGWASKSIEHTIVLERLVDKPFTKIWHHNLTAEQFKYNFLSKLLSEKEAQGVV